MCGGLYAFMYYYMLESKTRTKKEHRECFCNIIGWPGAVLLWYLKFIKETCIVVYKHLRWIFSKD